MENELNFSLSYDQLTRNAENEIRKCDLRQSGENYVEELERASDIFHIWFILTLRGHSGVVGMERIEADRQRLEALIRRKQGEGV